ncbi:hypothetical protein CH302_00965 [Rhodococcus sp. 15-2388-1-1a]|uniref:hypothetical protein n=1 Tax=Nocardiaceae TaxID=85025 RepID=UPI00055FF6BF|nr:MULTISPECIES: hypothetical protein [Rhodococcus]OZF05225.1 hypothetical protein CH302_00965 [Rhodococcus sp. 15-2388-1-1a]
MPELITIVQARGIGETLNGTTMCSVVTDPLPRDRFRVVNVRHRSEYGPVPVINGQAYNRTRAEAIRLALIAIEQAPGPVVLVGYSGGADAMGDLAAQIGRGVHGNLARTKLIAVVLIADPKNPRILFAPQWGIAGSRLIHTAAQVWRANDPNDVIPLCDANSPLRTVADQTDAMSLVDLAGWGISYLAKLRARQLQAVVINWRDPASVRYLYDRAIEQFNGYRNGEHVNYHRRIMPGTGRTYTAELTRRIAGLA